MPTWRLVESSSTEPGLNLAIEESLVRSLEGSGYSGLLRLWRDSRSVILGRFQKAVEEVDLEYCAREGIGVFRRISGGGAVYHDLGVLNFTVVVDSEAHPEFRDPERAYEIACRPLLELLRERGLDPEPSRGVFVGRRKVAGLAQYRYYNVVLVHGSVLLSADLGRLSRALLRKKYRVANLSELLGEEVEDFKSELLNAFERVLGVELEESRLSEAEGALALRLKRAKYSNPLYNIGGRKPRLSIDVYLCEDPSAKCLEFDRRVWSEAARLSPHSKIIVRRHYIRGLEEPYVLVDGVPLQLSPAGAGNRGYGKWNSSSSGYIPPFKPSLRRGLDRCL